MLCHPQAIIVICIDESLAMHSEDGQIDKMAWMDLGAAMQNMLLATHEVGLGACPTGSFHEKALTNLLHLPERIKLALLITIGVPELIPEAPRKRLFEEISFNDVYGGKGG
jgi:nitroreductase